MPRRPTAAQLREKRSRTLAIAFSVVFLAVMVIQGPKLMKALHGGSPPPGGTVAGALPAGVNPSVPTAAASGTAAAVLADGHLADLSQFALKDPFHALVGATSSAKAASGSKTTPAAKKPAQPAATKSSTAGAAPAVTFSATKTPPPPPNAAVVKTNGSRQTIFVGDAFPAADPLFKLVALGKKDIRIGVVGGSFTSGTPTIKLMTGKRLTLDNKSDGVHYVLVLVGLTNATPPAPTTSGSGSTPATTTTTPATTAPTTTTPFPTAPTTTTSTTTTTTTTG